MVINTYLYHYNGYNIPIDSQSSLASQNYLVMYSIGDYIYNKGVNSIHGIIYTVNVNNKGDIIYGVKINREDFPFKYPHSCNSPDIKIISGSNEELKNCGWYIYAQEAMLIYPKSSIEEDGNYED